MFNLIVSGRVDNDRKGAISSERVLQFTDEEIRERFMPSGKMDIDAVIKLPTLLMEEGRSDEIARIAWLSKIARQGSDYQLNYSIDLELPRITNADIDALATELHLHDWELGTNHWAIKDVDLFHVLLVQKLAKRAKPRVFPLSEKPVDAKLISLMMPFSAGFGRVHATVKVAIEKMGYRCRRADDFWVNSHIMQDVVELICTSRVVICDLSGKNPNVFYEAGIAHTLGKEVILITQSMEDVPFDLRALRCITYLNNQEGCDGLAASIVDRLKNVL